MRSTLIFLQKIINRKLISTLVAFLAFTYFIFAFHDTFMKWYDASIIPILALFKSNIWIIILTFVLTIICVCDLTNKYKIRYQYTNIIILTLFFVSAILITNRISGKYEYVYWLWNISYIDVVIVTCISYFIIAFINKARLYYCLYIDKDNQTKSKELMLNDWPILSSHEDLFDLTNEAIKISKYIDSLSRNKSWSIAITAPWGTGKTSFINLVKEHIKGNEYEILTFIPRDSKSYHTIQEDFFSMIVAILSKYDFRCSDTLKKYMASLQLIDNRWFGEKLTNFYKIWDKNSLKESIRNTFISLNKRILVIIDDFDRLSKEEILEVLKLIDSNAAFPNLIFLTAYDKEQVNIALGESYRTKDANFTDKFFNLEFSIPSRPYSYISRYIEEQLCKALDCPSNDERQSIQRTLTSNMAIFSEHIPTLRDAKRFINQFVTDFEQVRGDVIIDEYLLIQLIKYRYPNHYKEIYQNKYVDFGNKLYFNLDVLYLKDNIDKDLVILPILKILFPTDKDNTSNSYRHIFEKHSFNNYFVNQIYSSLRIKDMSVLFAKEWNDVIKTIEDWSADEVKIKDYIDYLNSFELDDFESKRSYMRYVEIITFLSCRFPHTRAYWLFIRTIYIPNLNDYLRKYGIDSDAYKHKIMDIIQTCDINDNLITTIHIKYKTGELIEDEELIKDSDIWPRIKNNFITAASEASTDEASLLTRLHNCVDSMESASRRFILDKECLEAYRKRIEYKPDYYIYNFVYLGGRSSSPDYNSIACEPFWKQIFQDEVQFEAYLQKCLTNNIAKASCAWNFWQLYKANDFKPIFYTNQGPVQDKIDNGLVYEVEMLNNLISIKAKVDIIPDDINLIDSNNASNLIDKLSLLRKELDGIELYISLHGKLLQTIDSKIEKLRKVIE